jgi:hypothetical protein
MHPFDDLLCHAWSDIDGELLDERRGREREEEESCGAFVSALSAHAFYPPFLFPHHKIHFGLKK